MKFLIGSSRAEVEVEDSLLCSLHPFPVTERVEVRELSLESETLTATMVDLEAVLE